MSSTETAPDQFGVPANARRVWARDVAVGTRVHSGETVREIDAFPGLDLVVLVLDSGVKLPLTASMATIIIAHY